ncbi:MAG: hypothetical protein WA977_12195 [Halobacteriota archaeon]
MNETTDLRRIRTVLENLNDIGTLRKLFVEKLNYDYANQELLIEFPKSIKGMIHSTKIISEKGDFKVILCTVDDLSKSVELPAVKTISSYYPYNLIIFTNDKNDEFHFPINTKYVGKGETKITVGRTDRLRTAAKRLSKIYAPDGIAPLALVTQCEEAFGVKAVSEYVKREWNVLCISDLHVGSNFGLFPKGFKTRSGNEIKLNKLQEELWNKWQRMKEDIGKYDAVFLLGDLVRGYEKHQLIANLNEQMSAALKLLRPLCKKKKVFVITEKSRYRDSADFEIDKSIAKHLNGYFGGPIANVPLKGTNKIINIAHHGSVYVRMPKDKVLSSLSELLMIKFPAVDILIRHYPTYVHREKLGKHIILNPGFVGPILNLRSISNYFHNPPDTGVVKLEISADDINVIPCLY